MRPDRAGTARESLEARLDAGLARLRSALCPTQRDALIAYVGLLAKWNAVYNLTSVRDPFDMVAVHLLDSLAIVPLLDRLQARIVVDVGSGAGLPGIPVAIARPAWTVHSIDAVAKKVGFQQQVRAALPLPNLHPVHQRVEAFTLAERPVIVSRAFAELRGMVAAIDRLAGPGTRVVAMKGLDPADEISALPSDWIADDVVALDVPFLGAERTAVLLRRAD